MSAKTIIPVVPDGASLDHVAEFAYAEKDDLARLFAADQRGYFEALATLVQTISVGGIVGISAPPAKIAVTDRLKADLEINKLSATLQFFDPSLSCQRKSDAYNKLKEKWQSICDELEDLRSLPSEAFRGYLGREFFYVWKNDDWQTWMNHYSPEEDALPLPDKFRRRALSEVQELARNQNVPVSKNELEMWIDVCTTTHYRIFFEYDLYLANETGADYMPSITRSALGFLWKNTDDRVESLILPFIALKAVEKVKQRRDLIKREFPRLCRGGSKSLTVPSVHPRNSSSEPPSTPQGESGWTNMKA